MTLVRTEPPTDSDERACGLRSIERLRCGLPPSSHAARLSVGTAALARSFGQFLNGNEHDNNGFLVLGDYGTGKSHALTLLREMGLAAGFATCWLTADGFECALNHPQRFLATLLGTLETPSGDGGYAALLTRLLGNPDTLPQVADTVLQHMTAGAQLDLKASSLAFLLREVLKSERGHREDEQRYAVREELIRLLAGEPLTGSAGLESYRLAAYRLLAVACGIVAIAGCRGLVVIIDEVESVFTKLPNRLSRQGAYRVLSALIHGQSTPTIRVAIGMTPDADTWIRADIAHAARNLPESSIEPVRRLNRSMAGDQIPTWQCRQLSEVQLTELLERTRDLYSATYPNAPTPIGSVWRRKVASILEQHPPTRLAIREVVDELDRLRFGIA